MNKIQKPKNKKQSKPIIPESSTRESSRENSSSVNKKGKVFDKQALAKIKVVGVGGAGGNAVTRMREEFPRGVEAIVINTDLQDLEFCDARKKIYIGKNLTKGLGAGMNPEIGRQAAEENHAEIAGALSGADMVFLTAGYGGGTGSGALPVIADIARDMGILTAAVITKPFSFEGFERQRIAEEAVARTKDKVDTLIIIPNDRIFSVIDRNTSLTKAFEAIDDVLQSAILGIADVIYSPGIINIDFADIKAITQNAGSAVISVGMANGAERAVAAANLAINSPLLEISIDGAKRILFNVCANRDLRMSEVNEIARMISERCHQSAKIIFGAYNSRKLKKGSLKVILIAADFNGDLRHKEIKNLTLPILQNNIFGTEPAPTAGRTEILRPIIDEIILDDNQEEEKIINRRQSFIDNKQTKPEKENGDDHWDIPTFLRKKRK